ncbi:hypothetical protein AMTRI_Chr03g52030 [Amborella trichopoda]
MVHLFSLVGQCHGALQVGFYNGKCGTKDVESMVQGVVAQRFKSDNTIVAALLRLQFHDCFVSGCDASLLLDGTSSEKNAPPNLSVRGYDIINQAKAAVEAACPELVSCADIIALAARDAVSLAGGRSYAVQTGRRDALFPATNVNLPGPSISVSQAISAFKSKGLSTNDMVLLLGAHTVGVTHCPLFQNRLYNFNNTGKPDPTMNPTLASQLRTVCPNASPPQNTAVNLDQNASSAFIVDNDYYKQILSKRGILQIDQALALDSATRTSVMVLAASNPLFSIGFGNAMVKMGSLQILTGTQGQVRKVCNVANG